MKWTYRRHGHRAAFSGPSAKWTNSRITLLITVAVSVMIASLSLDQLEV